MADGGWHDHLPPQATVNDFNAVSFVVQSMLSRMRTGTLVKVVGVTNDGGLAPIGTVDIQPLVNLMDGNRQATPHGTIHKCPYLRVGGGSNAVILDPQVGDIGWAAFADRDIQSALATQGPANPGSARMFDWADGVYLYTVVSGTPTQTIQFNTDGITIKSPTVVKVQAPDIQADCQTIEVTASGAATVSADSATVTTTGDLTATVGGTATVAATGDLNLSGANVNITATTSVNLTAGTQMVFDAPPAVGHTPGIGAQFLGLATFGGREPQLFP